MKIYLFFSTLSFTLVSFLIELLMSSCTGFKVFTGFNWFINPDLFSTSSVLSWTAQGFALSYTASKYIQPQTRSVDGFRFGLMTGLLFILIGLSNMLFHIDHSIYPFFTESLTPLVALYLLGFVINGWLFGLMFKVHAPNSTTMD